MKPSAHIESGEQSRPRLLVVDDEAPIREVLQTYLGAHDYLVSAAATEAETWRALKSQLVDLIILDVLLEDADGLDLLAKLKKRRPHCPVIMITGLGADEELKRRALEKGAVDCVSKASPLDQLLAVVERALAAAVASDSALPPAATIRRDRRTHHAVSLKLPRSEEKPSDAQRGSEPAASAKADADDVRDASQATLAAGTTPESSAAQGSSAVQAAEPFSATPGSIARLATLTAEASHVEFGVEVFLRMLAAYHPNLANIAMRAVVLCKTLGEALQLPAPELQSLLWAAALQDVALVQVEKGLLNRWHRSPEKCAKEEVRLIQRHPLESRRLLGFCPAFKEAAEIIAAHHENWDGSGYPNGLKMEMIPWLARLLSVVTDYCRPHAPNEKTLKEIEAQADHRYDAKAVQAFVQSAASTPLPKGEREVLAADLRPGMLLAAEIVNWTGVFILGKGAELTNASITKVVHLSQAGQIEPRVLVYC